jgi:hypothetical protein
LPKGYPSQPQKGAGVIGSDIFPDFGDPQFIDWPDAAGSLSLSVFAQNTVKRAASRRRTAVKCFIVLIFIVHGQILNKILIVNVYIP